MMPESNMSSIPAIAISDQQRHHLPSTSPNNNSPPPRQQSRTTVTITSYGTKGPPLDFTSNIHLDARSIKNPPRTLRETYDGRCEGLRKDLQTDPSFQCLLEKGRQEIFRLESRLQRKDSGTKPAGADKQDHDANQITVGVACVSGRHRSVALAEELGNLPSWPAHFDVRVVHRDVESPHRHLELHKQNLERERRGEEVHSVGEEAVEEVDTDDESEDTGGGGDNRGRWCREM